MSGNGLFSDGAIRAFRFANQEGKKLNHFYIGTEPVLLGLIRETDCLASRLLREFGISADRVRQEVGKLLWHGTDIVTNGKLPHTPRAKKAIEYAMAEAGALNHRPVGTEHILGATEK